MSTLVPSPKAKWLAELATQPQSLTAARSVTATTWLGMDFRIGDRVIEKGGRHPARIDAVFPDLTANITFEDTGWRANVPLAELEVYHEGGKS
jgi:hypothetical protein